MHRIFIAKYFPRPLAREMRFLWKHRLRIARRMLSTQRKTSNILFAITRELNDQGGSGGGEAGRRRNTKSIHCERSRRISHFAICQWSECVGALTCFSLQWIERQGDRRGALGVARSWKNNAVNARSPNALNKLFSFCSSFRVFFFSLFF